MKALAQCLQEHPPIMLEAIASAWGLEVRGTEIQDEDARRQVVEALAQRMLMPDLVAEIVAGLDERERAALAQVAERGMVQAAGWSREYGEVERLGPARLQRLQPWLVPPTPAARLWYLGLVHRGYSVVSGIRSEVYFVPSDLLDALPPLQARRAASVLAGAAPPEDGMQQDRGLAITQDVLAFLCYIRSHDVARRAGSWLKASDLAHLGRQLSLLDREYVAFAQRLADGADLVQRRKGLVRPSLKAKDWLQAKPLDRLRALFDAWLQDEWDELLHLSHLDVQQAERRAAPLSVRRQVLDMLRAAQVGVWYAVGAFQTHIKQTNADFMRPNGDYDAWYVRDEETGQFLSGFQNWDRIEGALLRHLLCGPLHWLGITALSASKPLRFAVMRQGAALLGWEGVSWDEMTPTAIKVLPELSILALDQTDFYDLYQVSRFAAWEGRSRGVTTYRVTRKSLSQSFEDGVEIEQIVGFLRRATNEKVGGAALEQLRDWAKKYGQVRLARVVVLIARDHDTLAAMQAEPRLAGYFREVLSDRVVVVEEESMTDLVQLLKELGYWPQIDDIS